MKTTIIIWISLILTCISGQLIACSCIGERTVKEEVKHADAVVVGTVLSKQLIILTDSSIIKMFPNDSTLKKLPFLETRIAIYELYIQDIYKGNITNDTLKIYTGVGGGDCGFRFEIGGKYIVYGENKSYFGQVYNDFKFPIEKNTYWTYNCLRTNFFFQSEIIEIEKYAKRKNDKKKEVIFVNPEIPPIYKDGGDIGLIKFIKEVLRVPENNDNIKGRVYIGFTVDTVGNVKDIEIKRGLTSAANEEAIRVVKMLTFIPGSIYGKVIDMKMILPISFNIENNKDDE